MAALIGNGDQDCRRTVLLLAVAGLNGERKGEAVSWMTKRTRPASASAPLSAYTRQPERKTGPPLGFDLKRIEMPAGKYEGEEF
jgi:hypothetical protein